MIECARALNRNVLFKMNSNTSNTTISDTNVVVGELFWFKIIVSVMNSILSR